MGKILNKSDIFQKASIGKLEIEIPEWGGSVYYKPMSMYERREIRKNCMVTTRSEDGENVVTVDQEKLEVWAVITCTYSEDGKLLFSNDDFDELEKNFSAGPLSKVGQAILKASGLMPDAVPKSENQVKA